MFFYLSKIVWFLLQPSSVIFLCLLVGTLLTLANKKGRGLFLSVGLLGLLVFGLSPVPRWMMENLESQSLPTAGQSMKVPVGTILLGGFVDTVTSTATGQMMTTDSADRLLTTQILMTDMPSAPMIITGGANPLVGGKGEAVLVEEFLKKVSLHTSQVYVENEALNTAENATKTLALINKFHPQLKDKPWLLVTSAFHMKRSRAIFEKAGLGVIPVPTDFRSEVMTGRSKRGYRSIALGLKDTDIVMKEHVGYFVYWMTGRL